MIELICDVDANGPTHCIVSKTDNGLYHICCEDLWRVRRR